MQRVLSLGSSPPLAVPLRFFLTAPLFAVIAGLLLAWQGPSLLASRWLPGTLAFTHLITLGFLSMSMVGALIQILQVAAGVTIPYAQTMANAVHALLCLGASALAGAFLGGDAYAYGSALICLVAAFAWLAAACAAGILRAAQVSPILAAIRYALAGLVCTVILGTAAGLAISGRLSIPLETLANLHAGWGTMAWIGLLVIGVAYQVVPMFQVTEAYPKALTQGLARTVFGGLAVWALSYCLLQESERHWSRAPLAVAVIGYGIFAVVTLHLIRHRKRPQTQATTLFWYLSLTCLLAAIALWTSAQFLPNLADDVRYPPALGLLILIGFAYSLVNGMLYKIVPFLVWYHLQEKLGAQGMKAPNVRQIVDEKHALRQFLLHLSALLLLLASFLYPSIARVAGLLFAADAGWLLMLLAKAALLYRANLPPHLPTQTMSLHS
jgi:hypothetical protein